MKFVFAICLFLSASFAWAAEPHPSMQSESAVLEGKVIEVLNVEGFTYLRLDTRQGKVWAAVIKGEVKTGDAVTLDNVSVMNNFESKSLKRTFDQILFGNLVATNRGAAKPSALGSSFNTTPPRMSAPKLDVISDAPTTKAAGANAKTVVVRGKVVKYNADIMGKNWVHLQDGSGSEAGGTNDILVTTTSETRVGAVVTVTGVVHIDKDFGAGYAYKVLIEEAKLQ
ncbi:MAG: nucleic acid binding, OB-fold, tRNA/helicase-type [Gallionellaceae bacterium]|nr:MAG: nucleic acid binding, OB-fold, tRNA/helicase-type [Gallionellaceae bacterium]